MSVRKAHNSGRNHLRNVVDYYQRTAYLPLIPSPKLTKLPRNRPRESPVCHRLDHVFIRSRRPILIKPNARSKPRRPTNAPLSISRRFVSTLPFPLHCPRSNVSFRRPTSAIRHARNAPNARYASPRRSPPRHDPTTRRPRNAYAALPARTRHASSASRDAIPTSRWSPSEFPVPAAARWIPTSAWIPAAPWRSWVRSAESGTTGRARPGSE